MCKLCGQCAAEAVGGPLACITCEQEGYMRGYENEHYAVLGRRFERLAREIGGEAEDGIRLLERMAHIMQQERDKETTPLDRARGPYEALGRIHERYKTLEEFVEKSCFSARDEQDAAMFLIVEAARFWLGEHNA